MPAPAPRPPAARRLGHAAAAMATVPPRYLDQAARILGRKSLERPTAAVFRNLARLALPPGEVNAAARNVPAPALRNGHDVSPLSVRFDDAVPPVADGPLAGETVVVKDSIDVAGTYTGMGLRDGGDFARGDPRQRTDRQNYFHG